MPESSTTLRLYGREVKVTRYAHGGARFYVDDEMGRGLVADTYSLVATEFFERALRRALAEFDETVAEEDAVQLENFG